MSNDSYKTGQFLGRHWKAVAVVAIGSSAVISYFVVSRPWPAAAEQAVTEQATLQARNDARLKAECSNGAIRTKADARKALETQNPDGALSRISSCNRYGLDDELTALKAEATAASALKNELRIKTEKIAKAEAEKAQLRAAAIDKARRKKEGVSIGMTQAEVEASSWGRPRKINRTTGANYVREQWVYDGGYLYFHDGVLRTIQN